MRGNPGLVITLIIMDYYEFCSLAGIKLEQMESYSTLSITLILTKKPKTIRYEEINTELTLAGVGSSHNMETKEEKLYSSIREAAREIGCNHKTLMSAEKVFIEKGRERLIKGRFLVKISR